jgi:hypothetical protein
MELLYDGSSRLPRIRLALLGQAARVLHATGPAAAQNDNSVPFAGPPSNPGHRLNGPARR